MLILSPLTVQSHFFLMSIKEAILFDFIWSKCSVSPQLEEGATLKIIAVVECRVSKTRT